MMLGPRPLCPFSWHSTLLMSLWLCLHGGLLPQMCHLLTHGSPMTGQWSWLVTSRGPSWDREQPLARETVSYLGHSFGAPRVMLESCRLTVPLGYCTIDRGGPGAL